MIDLADDDVKDLDTVDDLERQRGAVRDDHRPVMVARQAGRQGRHVDRAAAVALVPVRAAAARRRLTRGGLITARPAMTIGLRLARRDHPGRQRRCAEAQKLSS
jgi:hypothetical protein